MILFNQNNVSIELQDLYFDNRIEGAVAKIQITNNSNNFIDVVLCDIWYDDEWFEEWSEEHNIAPKTTTNKTKFYLASDTDDERILKFHNGEIGTFTCCICVRESGNYSCSAYGRGTKIQVKSLSLAGIEVLPTEHFEISLDGEVLFASTNHYIPFEIPRSETEKTYQIKTFKQELIKKIDLLSAPRFGRILMAQYGEIGESRFFDIENMCIYNLGTSVFSASCPTDIVFSELKKDDITLLSERFDLAFDGKYYYAYSWLLPDQLATICHSKPLVAKWNNISIKAGIPNTPYRYWLSIREQYKKIDVCSMLEHPSTSDFGIKITLHLPKKVLPTGVMKPILDGVVCAFHKSGNIDNILHSLTNSNFIDIITEAEKHLSLFGERNYVDTYRENSIKWNPADERLKFAWISVVEEECIPYFDGEIYVW